MKSVKFYILLGLSVVVLILTVVAISTSRANIQEQNQLQAKQADISKGGMSQQIGTNLVKDIAIGAQNDQKLRDLLTKNGFTLQTGTQSAESASPSPSASPSTSFKP